MSAAETIAKAIEKLEKLRAITAEGPWRGWKQYNPLYGVRYGIEDAYGEEVATTVASSDTELIEVLHRTIGAQLAILQHALEAGLVAFDGHIVVSTDAVALAEAILGGDV